MQPESPTPHLFESIKEHAPPNVLSSWDNILISGCMNDCLAPFWASEDIQNYPQKKRRLLDALAGFFSNPKSLGYQKNNAEPIKKVFEAFKKIADDRSETNNPEKKIRFFERITQLLVACPYLQWHSATIYVCSPTYVWDDRVLDLILNVLPQSDVFYNDSLDIQKLGLALLFLSRLSDHDAITFLGTDYFNQITENDLKKLESIGQQSKDIVRLALHTQDNLQAFQKRLSLAHMVVNNLYLKNDEGLNEAHFQRFLNREDVPPPPLVLYHPHLSKILAQEGAIDWNQESQAALRHLRWFVFKRFLFKYNYDPRGAPIVLPSVFLVTSLILFIPLMAAQKAPLGFYIAAPTLAFISLSIFVAIYYHAQKHSEEVQSLLSVRSQGNIAGRSPSPSS